MKIKGFSAIIQLRKIQGGLSKKWVTTNCVTYIDPLRLILVQINKGFKTNKASIPFILWWWLPPSNAWDDIFILHDKMYSSECDIPRKKCDKCMLRLLRNNGMGKSMRKKVYAGVRTFGWMFYRKHKVKV